VLTFRWLKAAVSEWIAGVARPTSARRQVIHHLAVGVRPTRARARILTPVAYTGAVRCAVCVQYAFRTATFVRVTHIVGEAGARSCSVLLPTNCVRSARGRQAGRRSFLRKWLRWNGPSQVVDGQENKRQSEGTQCTHAILDSKLPYIAAPRTAWKGPRCNLPNTRRWACGSPLGILHWLRTIRDMGLGISGSCMPGDLHIHYCSRIPADSLAENPCSRVGKSMTGRLRTPGK